MVDRGRVGEVGAGLVDHVEFADGGNDVFKVAQLRVRERFGRGRHPGAVGHQVGQVDAVLAPGAEPVAAVELGNDVHHPGAQGEPSFADGLVHQGVGEGLGQRQHAEDAVRFHGAAGGAVRPAERGVQCDFAVAGHDDAGAVVVSDADVVPDGLL